MMRPLAFLLVLMLAACVHSAPTAYYLLESSAEPVRADSLPAKTLRIARVVVPEYLNRGGIVSRVDGQTRLVVAQFNVWAEPLDQGVRRVVREELAPQLLEAGVNVQASGDDGGDVVLFLDVRRLDGTVGGKAYAELHWSLKNRHDAVLGQGSHADEEPVRGREYTDLVRAESVLASRFATRLAGLLPPLMAKEKRE
ncbi:MAG: ABC-type transport auxiliary lipoprotein family protein [Desulfovibrio sp.]|jgi:uncharacterized lipoprotein YmbA|nr:ABC-type transport auxiliary lipoprotein family protein [Desulfovibrio sp.]